MLITKSDIATKRELSSSVQDKKINQYIEDAELSDLRELLGEELYQDIVSNPTTTANGSYPDLLDGSTYSYGNYTYKQPGIKSILIDFAYARYKLYGGETDTPFGTVNKNFEQGINSRQLKEIYQNIRKVAYDKWVLVKLYLDRKYDSYTYWFGQSRLIDDDDDEININYGTLQ